jgi:Domain of unknown function (DUF4158)/Tn3 transposase DDE domain
MARPLDLDELLEHFTVADDELELLRNKSGATRLGFSLLLRYLAWKGRFPRARGEIPDNAVDHVARQVGVSPEELGLYDWSGRQSKRHRVEVRQHLGFRECSVADADKLTAWLAEHVAQRERQAERVRQELLAHCRAERIEPPTVGRVDRMVASALHQAEAVLSVRIASRLSTAIARLEELVGVDPDDAGASDEEQEAEGPALLALIKSDPGNVSLESMLAEIGKLEAVRAVGLPPGLFADVAPKVVAAWRARATVEAPSHLRTHPEPLRLTLLAALLHAREREITDTLVDLLIATVHRINARAEKKITEELIREFKRVTGKETILFRLAEAAVDHPDDTVRAALFPAVPGGERTLRDLVAEYKQSGPTYRRSVQTTLKASYTSHYRKGLIRLLEVLAFRSSNTTHPPVIQALRLIGRHAHDGNTTYYPLGEHVPVHSGTTGDWEDLVWQDDRRGRRRVVRMAYEVATFQALRDRLRCKEIWVEGADRWRNPDQDLPADFEARRAEHYQALRKPLDPSRFIDELQAEHRRELAALNDTLPRLAWLDIADRPGGAIRLSPLDAAPEPRNLRRLKREVERRWGTVPLIDMLKEAALRTGCLQAVTAVAGRADLDPQVLAERLLLCVYAYGTNTGLRAVAAGDHRHTEDDLRYVQRRFLSAEAARAMAVELANATFAARHQAIWGEGSTAVASDSTHVGAFDQNIFTQWHSRYGTGVGTGSPVLLPAP